VHDESIAKAKAPHANGERRALNLMGDFFIGK
jgi:hypothetical protein